MTEETIATAKLSDYLKQSFSPLALFDEQESSDWTRSLTCAEGEEEIRFQWLGLVTHQRVKDTIRHFYEHHGCEVRLGGSGLGIIKDNTLAFVVAITHTADILRISVKKQ